MGRVHETVKTANSVVRTLLMAMLVLGAGWAGWKGYELYNQPRARLAEQARELAAREQKLQETSAQLAEARTVVERQSAELAALTEDNERLQATVRLLQLQRRVARLRVVDQQPLADSERVRTTVEFVEINDEGAPLGEPPRQFVIDGDRVYVECLVAKFEDRYVERADLERGTAICLFQRLFGEYQQPHEGFALDPTGSTPTSYARGGQISDFERQIWDDFWNIALDPARAAELGIRAAHADAPSIRVRPNGVYELELRSTGEFTLRPIDAAVADAP